jgi:hypothetical protein
LCLCVQVYVSMRTGEASTQLLLLGTEAWDPEDMMGWSNARVALFARRSEQQVLLHAARRDIA